MTASNCSRIISRSFHYFHRFEAFQVGLCWFSSLRHQLFLTQRFSSILWIMFLIYVYIISGWRETRWKNRKEATWYRFKIWQLCGYREEGLFSRNRLFCSVVPRVLMNCEISNYHSLGFCILQDFRKRIILWQPLWEVWKTIVGLLWQLFNAICSYVVLTMGQVCILKYDLHKPKYLDIL